MNIINKDIFSYIAQYLPCKDVTNLGLTNVFCQKNKKIIDSYFITPYEKNSPDLYKILKNKKKIKYINLDNCKNITISKLNNIVKNRRLILISLKRYKNINIRTNFEKLANNITYIEHIDLSYSNINNKQLNYLCSGLRGKGLISLSLNKTNITQDGLHNIYCLESLKSLNLRDTEATFYNNANGIFDNIKKLEHLDISHNATINYKSFEAISKLTILISLDLHNNKNIGFQSIVQLNPLKKLKYLNLSNCYNICNKTINFIFSEFHNLTELNLERCDIINDNAFFGISNLISLQTLNLNGCINITDLTLQILATSLIKSNNMLKLMLSGCYNITDNGILIISQSFVNLSYLDLCGCYCLTNKSAQYIQQNLKKLKFLDATGCYNITNFNISYFNYVKILTL